ncbi:MAG: cytochrome c biogenesis protein CcsA [Prevotellaceae bacterium]|jgi:ABC-type transport system involved in cytochrome c biogenesis permease subunit|nr:cytochrome c biogenesis protein CcsA [Prevotellaceae bacterium]
MQFFRKNISLILWSAVIIVLAAATVIEKYCGTDFAHRYIYGSWWFVVLWAMLAAGLLVMVFRRGVAGNAHTRLLHLSFVIILAGALCTKLWGERGQIILQQNAPAVVENIDLPFAVSLDTFYVNYYAGTNTPADYVSEIRIENERATVSMNNIFSHKGYRFYQSSYNEQTTVLTINHDPVGIAVTYTGYALFVLAGLLLMFRTQMTQIFADKLKKSAKICVICVICVPHFAFAADTAPTITETQAQQFGNLWLQYDGKITSVSAFAHDFALKLTGKTSFGSMNAEQFLAGFLFFPEEWQNAAVFDIKDPALQKLLNAETQCAAFSDFFDAENNYKLALLPRSKEIDKLNDKIQLINLLHSGVLLQMFPIQENGKLHWYYPTENFPPTEKQGNITFVRTVLTNYYTALHSGNNAEQVLQRIAAFQQQNAGEFLPSERHKQIEIFYLRHNFIKMLFMVNLAGGILALLLMLFRTQKTQTNTNNKFAKIGKRLFSKFFLILLIHSFCFLTLSIGLRTYIGGRLPFATGAETMLIVAWLAMLGTLISDLRYAICDSRKSHIANRILVVPFGLLVSGCALLVAHLSMSNPKITPLVPVLQSPLLSLHVSVIMIAYTLLAFTALNSLVALISDSRKSQIASRTSIALLRPALFLLGTGIFIGAVWANVSWGTYWSWDPKEVWALITFMTYSLALHKKMSDTAFHVFILCSFLTVLITYFGVNYFFGGMHGYG